MTPGLQGLIDLLDAPSKRVAKKLCRDLIIDSEDFSEFIRAGWLGHLKPYVYARYFSDQVPPHVPPTKDQMSALAQHGSGIFAGDAARAATRLSNTTRERRLFIAHLLYLKDEDFWSLFYFDQRDRSNFDNHWKVGGPHIHYCCEAFVREPLEVLWEKICQTQPSPPSSEHIRYIDRVS